MQFTSRAIFLLFMPTLFGCASTSLDDSWKDPNYSGGPVSKVLVVGVSTQAKVRQDFEETFAQALNRKGVQAVASYTLIPENGKIPEDALQKAIEKTGADAVLITRMVSKTKEVSMLPATMPPPALST